MTNDAIKERPIPLKAWEVRAILDGRKTQARRLMKPQPEMIPSRSSPEPGCGEQQSMHWWPCRDVQSMVNVEGFLDSKDDPTIAPSFCPHGGIGDRLWVRETHCQVEPNGEPLYEGGKLAYVERYGANVPIEIWYKADVSLGLGHDLRWTPSIHMPRWASRLTLEITDVRVERLQSISEADALAEGCDGDCPVGYIPAHAAAPCGYHFAQMWESINGEGSWAGDPWVWCLSFRRIEPATPGPASRVIRPS